MKLFSLVRASLLAALPFLFHTLASAQLTGELPCSQLIFTTPCIDLPLQDWKMLLVSLAAVYESAARLVPTQGNYTLPALLARVLDALQVNERAAPPAHGLV
jgi:hypothetical protein